MTRWRITFDRTPSAGHRHAQARRSGSRRPEDPQQDHGREVDRVLVDRGRSALQMGHNSGQARRHLPVGGHRLWISQANEEEGLGGSGHAYTITSESPAELCHLRTTRRRCVRQ